MKIIANRQLHGIYGTLRSGDAVDLLDDLACELIKRGVASAYASDFRCETQSVTPQETQSVIPPEVQIPSKRRNKNRQR